MSIETVAMYRVVCDRCGKCAQDGTDYFAWAQDEGALNDAREADWLITDDGHHYCCDCVQWNEAEDELVPKPSDQV
jgi:hypothetical protein